MPARYTSLSKLRTDIDDCNIKLLELLNERAELSLNALSLKEKAEDEIFDPARQAQMLADLVKANRGPLSDNTIMTVFQGIFQHIVDLMTEQRGTELEIHRKPGEPDRVYQINGHLFGKDPVYIAGPCAVESEQQLDAVARVLRQNGVVFLRGGAFKPRTSPYAFQGLGEEGLLILRQVADRYGMVSVTEVLDPRDVVMVATYVDILQVGARNMYNYPLLRELGKIENPVLLKRAFSASLDELLLAAEYIVSGGNQQIIFCERGIRTFTRETRNTLEISAVPLLASMTACPVMVDVSHAVGRTDILAPLVAAAFAVGAKGVMLEVHPHPATARSDIHQQLSPDAFVSLMHAIETIWTKNIPAPAPDMRGR